MLYAIFVMYLLQSFILAYAMFILHDTEVRLKDLEEHLFDV